MSVDANDPPADGDSASADRGVATHPAALAALAFAKAVPGMAVLDAQDRLLTANVSFSQILGVELDDLRGRPIGDLLPGMERMERHDDDEAMIWRVLIAESPGGFQRELIVSLRTIAENDADPRRLLTLAPLEEVLAAMPGQDAFTGTSSAWLFQDRLIHAMARADRLDQGLAVLLIELDDYPALLKRLGREKTSRVLRHVSRRVGGAFRGEDSVAGLGPSRWAVLLEHPVTPQSLHAAAQRFQEVMDAPFDLSGRPLLLTTSIGISRYPEDGDEDEELLAGAERALARARKSGPGGHAFLEKGLRGRLEEEAVLRHQLQEALLSPGDHFHLVYQPIISVDKEACLGLEALVRWVHPDRGVLRPHDFLPEASALGLMIRLDRWVLEEVIHQHGQWQSQGSPLADLAVSVNLDAGILEQRVFDGRPLDLFLRQQGAPLDWLTLEIELSGLLARGQEHRHLLKRLEQLGITLVADDLGRVPIDFVQLAMLPLASAKIGPKLAAELSGKGQNELTLAALRQCLVALGMSVVLVGVETQRQRDTALAMGFSVMQGNLYSAPLREAALIDWLATRGS